MTALSKQMHDAAVSLAVMAELDAVFLQDVADLACQMSGWVDRVETMELRRQQPAQACTVTLDERIARLFGVA